ncbi:MAG: undecaprenyl-phosphate glucose phosphotransferase [Bacteroidota bacterium]
MSSANSTDEGGPGGSPPRHRRGDILFPLLTVASDALAVEASFLFSYWLRFQSSAFDSLGFVRAEAPPIGGYLAGSVFVTAAWILLFNARRMYRTRRNASLAEEFLNVVRVVTLGMLIVMSAAFFYRDFSYSRIVFGLLWGTSIPAIFAGRAALQAAERRLYRRGRHLQEAVLIGTDELAGRIHNRLHRHPAFGIHIAGYFAEQPVREPHPLAQAVFLGNVETSAAYIRSRRVDLVLVAVGPADHARVLDLAADCEGLNVAFMMVPDLLEIMTSRVRVRELEGIPFLQVKGIPLTYWGKAAKRALDLGVASCALLALSPLLGLIALAVRLESPGPVLFRQMRAGLDGRPFRMLKFRSMRAGAEKEDEAAGLGIPDDPRRTRVGRLLRRMSLDELPQLWNVLRGDMSLVGPRPERLHQVRRFEDSIPKYLDRHRVKTGMTGWAQVHGLRGDTSLEERIRYDLYYIENWSLALDITILLRTLKAALCTRGGG